MALLTGRNIHKSYGHKALLSGLTISVEEGERVGLLGRNGCGKSTLLKILAGVEPPDSGERITKKNLQIGYLEQEPELDPNLTIRETVHLGLEGRQDLLDELDRVHVELSKSDLAIPRMETLLARQTRLEDRLHLLGGHDVEHRVEEIIHNLGLADPDARCEKLSGGEKRRVALAQLLLSGPDLLLLDEPTNHLDAVVTDWLEDFLLETDTPLLMVTHDRYFLDRVVHRMIEMDRGETFSYEGGYGDYLVARAARVGAEERAERSRLNLLRRETEWMRRGPPARTTKAKARIRRYQQIVSGAPADAVAELMFTIPPGPKLGNRAIKLTKVSKKYGDRVILEPLDLEIGPGTRLGIVGPNGAGKTTLLKICSGLLAPDAGTVEFGPSAKVAIIDQQRSDLDPEKTIIQEIAGQNDVVKVGDRVVRIESFLDQLLFPGSIKFSLVGKLSGGERNRVLLGKLLLVGGNVLALDEPTNDLDLSTLRALEEALIAFQGAVLVVSHDRYFLDRVATQILYLDGSGRARMHEGDLGALLAKLADERDAQSAVAKSTIQKPAAAPAEVSVKLTWKERKELESLPSEIAAAEAEMTTIDANLADPELYIKRENKLEEFARSRRQLDLKIHQLYARWQDLESRAKSEI
ncbi:MAG: ATP-binding cassette domain-containing protein [Planctomycetes bacterium]|nr:ATP-binding cassette domain-containing protein [Planctomycetota bacterium]